MRIQVARGSLDADTGCKGRPDADTAGCEGGAEAGGGPGTKGSQRILTKAGAPKNGRVVGMVGRLTCLG
jgi:hypothetical protein